MVAKVAVTAIGRWLAAGLLAIGLAWGAGFTWFDRTARRAPDPPPAADAIVVLTGGADRIDTALHLLADAHAPALLVSGVGRGADLAELTRRVPLSPEQAEHVTLGRGATTTAGNAAETAAWARARGVHSLLVVTAFYHMPRALLELGRSLPDVALHPVPVRPPALRGGLEWATVRLMASEFDKFLAVWAGFPRRADAP